MRVRDTQVEKCRRRDLRYRERERERETEKKTEKHLKRNFFRRKKHIFGTC